MKRAFTVGRQEHPKDPGSGRHEPLCHVVGFGVDAVAGRKLEESGPRSGPGC